MQRTRPFVERPLCFYVHKFFFILLNLVQTVGSGSMLMMKMREDEASVASTPLAKQLSNQASDYISSPMKTKTITGTLQGQGKNTACTQSKMVENIRFNLPILTPDPSWSGGELSCVLFMFCIVLFIYFANAFALIPVLSLPLSCPCPCLVSGCFLFCVLIILMCFVFFFLWLFLEF